MTIIISGRNYLVYVSLNSHPNGFSCLRLVGVSVHLVQTKFITVECWKVSLNLIFLSSQQGKWKNWSVFISSFAIFTPCTQNNFGSWKCNQFQLLTFILQFFISVEYWTLSSTFNFPLVCTQSSFLICFFQFCLSFHSLIHNNFQFSVTMDGHYLEMPL